MTTDPEPLTPVPSPAAAAHGMETRAPDRRLPSGRKARAPGDPAKKPTRSLSGVTVVAVMTSPDHCPHGRCTYCPGGVDFGTPQSYTGEEPAALRGAQLGYDPYRITRQRLETLSDIGHPISKVEVILMGGTYTSRPTEWQEATIRRTFDALNQRDSTSMSEAHAWNRSGDSRCVGLTVETRPDQASWEQLTNLVSWGVTRVEYGVESIRDEVLDHVHRAHDVGAVVEATRRARDLGLKVSYHMMPGLPGMDPTKDREDFRSLFSDERFRPDMMKIYPCLVMRGTPLYDEWKRGEYRPYDVETAAQTLASIKEELPRYVRIQRIQRDIPARLIADGVRKSNLREIALDILARQGKRCPCLRCRESGRTLPPARFEALELRTQHYRAGGGEEHMLSMEDPDTDALAGFLRLRLPSPLPEEARTLLAGSPAARGTPVIRELKVLGAEVPVGTGAHAPQEAQHRGLGRRMLAAAEGIAQEEGAEEIAVLSAIGTMEYYAKNGYSVRGPWMVKSLR